MYLKVCINITEMISVCYKAHKLDLPSSLIFQSDILSPNFSKIPIFKGT